MVKFVGALAVSMGNCYYQSMNDGKVIYVVFQFLLFHSHLVNMFVCLFSISGEWLSVNESLCHATLLFKFLAEFSLLCFVNFRFFHNPISQVFSNFGC